MTIEKLDTSTKFEKYRTDWSAEDDGFWSGVGTVMDQVNLSYGDDVAEDSRSEVFRGYENYEDNRKFYDAYADNTSWYKHERTEDLNRNIVEKHIESGRFSLDTQGNVVDTEDNWTTGMVFDMDMVKGALLAKQNGWGATAAKTAYKDFTAKRSAELQKETEAKDVGLGQLALGMVAGHGFRETTLKEIAVSPQKVIGKTIASAAMKAFSVEASIAVAGEIEREMQIAKHKELADEEYGLWDSAKNIMVAAGFAGGIRAGGSAFVDWRTIKNIKNRGVGAIAKELEKKGIPVEDAKLQEEVVTRFMRREQYMLTNNTTKHVDMMHKAERDIDNGKPVDLTDHTEISIEDKVKEIEPESNIDEIPENSLEVEVTSAPEIKRVDTETKAVEKTVDEATPYNPEMKDDPFEGSATKSEGETVIEEAGNKAEYDEVQAKIDALEKPLSERQQQIKEAAVPTIGGSEDEAKQASQQFFRKSLSDKYKGYSKEDIAEQEMMHQADLDMEANAVFAKFGDNLIAGTVAGIGEDEEGNITFNPEMFVAGLGGYTAIKALVKNKALRKTIGDSLTRRFNDLDDNPMFNMITGRQMAIDGRYKSDGLTKPSKKLAKEFGLSEEDIADMDAEDFAYFNKASRMIDNMDIQARKTGDYDLKTVDQEPSRPIEEIEADINKWTEEDATEEAMPKYKKGDVVTAEKDPTVITHKEAVRLKKVADKTTRDTNFKKWFSGSKVVDENGEPMVVYHGTSADFSEFDNKKSYDGGLWFTSNIEGINKGEVGAGTKGSIMPVYLKVSKLAGWDEYDKYSIDELISKGYDGIKLDEDFVVFEPNQIKSVNNKGAFSKDGNILKGTLIVPAVGLGVASQQENN